LIIKQGRNAARTNRSYCWVFDARRGVAGILQPEPVEQQ